MGRSKPDPVETCGRCHQTQLRGFLQDAHGRAWRSRRSKTLTCVGCHGSHDVLPQRSPASRTYYDRIPGFCGSCHPVAASEYRESAHAQALSSPRKDSATCTGCHAAHGSVGARAPNSPIARARVADTCGTCHIEAIVAYKQSVHAAAFERGDRHAATCVDCHGFHRIESPAAPASELSKLQRSGNTCARCHGSLPLMQRHEVSVAVVADFRGSFHGLAGALGDRRVANCASCHGYHEIRNSADTLSSINPANLSRTCGTCHPGAVAGFARGGIHHVPRNLGHRVVDWVRVMYRMMIVLVVGGMAVHNLVDLRRRWLDRRGRQKEQSE